MYEMEKVVAWIQGSLCLGCALNALSDAFK